MRRFVVARWTSRRNTSKAPMKASIAATNSAAIGRAKLTCMKALANNATITLQIRSAHSAQRAIAA